MSSPIGRRAFFLLKSLCIENREYRVSSIYPHVYNHTGDKNSVDK